MRRNSDLNRKIIHRDNLIKLKTQIEKCRCVEYFSKEKIFTKCEISLPTLLNQNLKKNTLSTFSKFNIQLKSGNFFLDIL